METQSNRIYGFDFARALAIIGMILVNFKTVMFTGEPDGMAYYVIEFLSGKAAALFVVLAGVGLTLMYKSAVTKSNNALAKTRKILLRRSLFLFVVGMSYYFIWPADILHYYGVFIAVGVLFLGATRKVLIISSIVLIFLFVGMCAIFNYEKGWNWYNLTYTGFFTINGFFRNMFFNGFHPVIPWLAFLLTGIWVGRINLQIKEVRNKVIKYSLILYLIVKTLSVITIKIFANNNSIEQLELDYIFGTTPMPPLPFYMFSAASLAVFVIAISITLTEKLHNNSIVNYLISTGKLALTVYFTHVVIGMGLVYLIYGTVEHSFTINAVIIFSVIFCLFSIIFAHLWLKKFKRGPLEMLMRKIAG